MRPRRAYGSGSKRERRPGVWELRVGGRAETFHGTSKEAERELSRMIARHGARSSYVEATTMGQLLDEWLGIAQIQRSTRETYLAALAHLPDDVRRWKLRKVNLRDFDRLYADLARGGVSANQIRKLHTVLSAALTEAVRWQWIDTHPARGARLPAVNDRKVNPPSSVALAKILDAAMTSDLVVAVWLRLALASGTRRGELLALRWSAVDLERATVTVATSIEEDRQMKSTKSNRVRRLVLDDDTVALLRQWRTAELERALAAGVKLARDPFVISNAADSGTPWRPDGATQRFRRLCVRAGVEGVRLHDLRHAHVSLLLRGGTPLQDVSPRVGHSRNSTTSDIYAHTMDDADVAAAKVIGEALRALRVDALTNP